MPIPFSLSLPPPPSPSAAPPHPCSLLLLSASLSTLSFASQPIFQSVLDLILILSCLHHFDPHLLHLSEPPRSFLRLFRNQTIVDSPSVSRYCIAIRSGKRTTFSHHLHLSAPLHPRIKPKPHRQRQTSSAQPPFVLAFQSILANHSSVASKVSSRPFSRRPVPSVLHPTPRHHTGQSGDIATLAAQPF